MNGKSVTKVVDARSFAAPGMGNAALKQQFSEQEVHRSEVQGSAVWRREEKRLGWTRSEVLGVLAQAQHQRRGGRNQPILAELAVAHRQDALLEVHIGEAQMQNLAEAKAATAKQTKDLGHDDVA